MHRLPHLLGHLQERVDQPRGVEYAWFNNVETKPGIGYPKEWENQEQMERRLDAHSRTAGSSRARRQAGSCWRRSSPTPTCRRSTTITSLHLRLRASATRARDRQATPTARPRSLITGKRMEKIEWGPNWEEILGGEFAKRSQDTNFDGDRRRTSTAQFENTFMMYLPRLCEHCLNPACVAACPSGSIYKREEDGIVLIDQDKCRGWRMCVSACPYKKIYYNWESGKAEKCIFCYPRIEAGQPTVCSETCVGRIRYLGVLLYDADRIEEAAGAAERDAISTGAAGHLPRPARSRGAGPGRADGMPEAWLEAARNSRRSTRWRSTGRSPFRCIRNTAPCRWSGTCRRSRRSRPRPKPAQLGDQRRHPGRRAALRIPVQYLANMLTAGDEQPVKLALERHARHARLHARQTCRRRRGPRTSIRSV